ncbi:MAG: TRAP transporter substrate-binding protein DctP [Proteobacteria bacterium]|nr:TRAP transporter substrate-binding protein DctP [Pseudomonadota bacterium]
MKRKFISVHKPLGFSRLIFLLVVSLFLLLIPGPGVFAAEKPQKVYEIPMGTLAPAGTPWTIAVGLIAPIIRDYTGGRIKIIPITSGLMGNDIEVLEKIRQDRLEGCGCNAAGLFEVAPELSVLSLPFLFSSFDEVEYVLNHLRPEIDRILESKGFARGAFVDAGFYFFYSRLDPSSLEKIRRQRTGSFWGSFELLTLKAIGIDPIPLNLAEITADIKAEKFDGTLAPASGVLGVQAYSFFRYFVEQPFYYTPCAAIFSRKTFDRIESGLRKDPEEFQRLKADFEHFKRSTSPNDYLRHQGVTDRSIWQMGQEVFTWLQGQELKSPEDLAPLVLNTTRMAEKNWGSLLRAFEEQTQQGFVRRGMKPVRLSDADMKSFQELSRMLQDNLVGKRYPREFLDQILQLKKEFSEKALQEIY